ncbi:MAG: hypothetical protein KKC18_00895 [Chloroflexi bacterium]|nr:hypothetical protein [Chloroflexota bacterium]
MSFLFPLSPLFEPAQDVSGQHNSKRNYGYREGHTCITGRVGQAGIQQEQPAQTSAQYQGEHGTITFSHRSPPLTTDESHRRTSAHLGQIGRGQRGDLRG